MNANVNVGSKLRVDNNDICTIKLSSAVANTSILKLVGIPLF